MMDWMDLNTQRRNALLFEAFSQRRDQFAWPTTFTRMNSQYAAPVNTTPELPPDTWMS